MNVPAETNIREVGLDEWRAAWEEITPYGMPNMVDQMTYLDKMLAAGFNLALEGSGNFPTPIILPPHVGYAEPSP